MKTYSEKEALRLKYLLTLILSILMWLFPGSVLSSLLYSFSFFRHNRVGVFILTFVPHTVMFLTLLVIYKTVFNSNITEAFGREEKKARKFIRDSSITLLVFIFFSTITHEAIVHNSEDSILIKLSFFLLAFPLLLGQTLTEEIVFRVLPERILSPKNETLSLLKRILLALFCGIFFLLPHLKNIEVTSLENPIIPIVIYFLWGAFSSFLSTGLHSYTSIWAMHFINNLYTVSFVGSKNSTLLGAPIFFSITMEISPLIIVEIVVLFFLVFLFESYLTTRGKE